MTLEGLRLSGNKGSFKAAQYGSDGSLLLLYDQGDGLRLLKMNAAATDITTQIQTGAAGDSGVAMALDPAGNVYVAGTSSSGALSGTSGVVYHSPADTTTNSFLAKFDSDLHLIFLTFLGGNNTLVAGVGATADAVFVTGVTYSTSFPVTSGGLQQAPADGSYGNGFVERFRIDGTALNYATYLTGTGGDTVPSGIAVNSGDEAFITGQTSATGFAITAALQPAMLGSASGFLSELTPSGNALVFSTYIAGSGLTGIALDPTTNTLLLSGNVAAGQFPVVTVAAPVANTPYQTLLRLGTDGQTVIQSVLLLPGLESFVIPASGGTAWVSGTLGTPLPVGTIAAGMLGDSFLLHVTQNGSVDQVLRVGGSPVTNPAYARLTSELAAPALSRDGSTIALPGTITAAVDTTLRASQHFDLSLTAPSSALPTSTSDLLPAVCTASGQCVGSGGLLSLISTGNSSSAANLTLSSGDLPNLTLRNAGPSTAAGLAVTATGYTVRSDCGSELAALTQCAVALSGSGPGQLTVSASNAPVLSIALPTTIAAPGALAFSPAELDFGIVTADSSPVNRTVTITNLTSTAQNFPSASDGAPTAPPYTLAETATTCGGVAGAHTISANSICTLTFGLSASTLSTNDGPVRAFWNIAGRDLLLTGTTQAAALSVSSAEVDFGLQLTTATVHLPRYLYLSNSSGAGIAHTPATLPANSPFSVTDACPSTLEPGTVCQFALTYAEANAPANDTVTLFLDQGLSVLVTGETLAPPAIGSSSDPSLSVSSTSLGFATPVVATEISSETQVLSITNNGTTAVPFAASVTAEFRLDNSCGSVLNPGATCDLVVQFAPSQPGVRGGLLSLTAGSTFSPLLVTLSGTGAPLLPPNNGTLSLGHTSVSEPAVMWYKVQAATGTLTASVTGSAFAVAIVEDDGAGHGTLAADAFTSSLTAACANCWLGVQFYPQTAGPASSLLTLSTTAGGNPYQLSLSATGVAVQGLVLTAPTSDFGTVPTGSSTAPVIFTLANLLSPASGINVAGVTATGDFNIISNATGGASCAGFLAATASCYIEVSFAPTATGMRTGTLTVQTSSGAATAVLSGSGASSPGLGLSPISLTFNNEPGIAAAQQTLTLTNTSSSPLKIGTITSSASAFTASTPCAILAAGANCTVTVIFTPSAAEITGSLTIPVSMTANSQLSTVNYTVPLAGTYTSGEKGLLLLPNGADYGAQMSGTVGETRQFTLTNTSKAAETISLAVPAQFPLAAPFTCTTLAAGASCSFSVSFLPETGGALTGSLFATATSDGTSTAQAIGYLLGYGTASGSLSISGHTAPGTPVNFGAVNSGASTQQALTLTNSGTGPLTVRRVATELPFAASTDCGLTLAPGSTCAVTVTYSPSLQVASNTNSPLPRTDAGTLSIESDSANSPDALALLGVVNPMAAGSTTGTGSPGSYQLSEGALIFANTQVGDTSAPQTLSLLNTGTQTLSIASILAPQDFTAASSCTALLPGTSCNVQIAFTPGSSSTATIRAATLEIQSNASNALEMVSLLGMSTAAPLQLSPSNLDFGTVDVPNSGQLPVTVTNTASLPILFEQATASGDYTVATGTCPTPGAALPAGQSCALSVFFTPSATGTRTGLLSVATNATQLPLTVALTGVGAEAKLQTSPGALAFGNISVGASAVLDLNMNDIGSGNLSAISTAITGPNAADFGIITPCPTTTLSPVAACTIQLRFTPSVSGTRTATLVITSSDPSGPMSVPLSGTGVQAGSFLLTVNGGSSATVTVPAGMPASYALMVTPQNGFSGMAAITCIPVSAAPYAGCSLLSSQLNLAVGAQASTVTITTVNGAITSSELAPFGVLFLAPLSWFLRRRRRSGFDTLCVLGVILAGSAACVGLGGCGGPGNNGLNLTPAGTYQYQVTANSVSGVATSSTVTLNLVVQ